MKHIDLYSGIGGFALACDWNDIETILFVEIDKFCQKVLNKHWPGVQIVGDINNVEAITNATREGLAWSARKLPKQGFTYADRKILLTAGFPCQPFSNAGRKRGSSNFESAMNIYNQV